MSFFLFYLFTNNNFFFVCFIKNVSLSNSNCVNWLHVSFLPPQIYQKDLNDFLLKKRKEKMPSHFTICKILFKKLIEPLFVFYLFLHSFIDSKFELGCFYILLYYWQLLIFFALTFFLLCHEEILGNKYVKKKKNYKTNKEHIPQKAK